MSSSEKPVAPASKAVLYELEFNVTALKEWQKLNATVRLQFAKKLKERLNEPKVDADKLRNMPSCYKIKLRGVGYRLIYEVQDKRLIVHVIAVGKRERSEVYNKARSRISKPVK